MNEIKIVSIDVLIDRIKTCGYIDCNEDGYYDEYEYDNILYYLEKYKNLQSKIDKAIEYINTIKDNTPSNVRKDFAKMILINYELLLDILKEDK